MFDIGWSEMAVIAFLTLIIIGPRELPRVLRTVGQWVRKAQSLAREFQRGLDDMAREADLEDAKNLIDAGRSIANPKKMIMDTLDPTGSIGGEAKELQAAMIAEPNDGKTTEKSAGAGVQSDGKQSAQPASEEPPAEKSSSKKSPAKKSPAKKSPAKKSPAKKSSAKKSSAKTSSAKKSSAKTSSAEDETAKATVIKHPVNIAPPHSLTPPPEPGAETKPETEPAGSDGSQKTA
jgi:sec-independent protein translocase protein TatB